VTDQRDARGPANPQRAALVADPPEQLRIGKVARAHGLKGELEIRLDWSDSRALLEAERVVLDLADGATELRPIAGTRTTHKGVLVQLEGVSDRTAAEARCGATVSVLRSDLPLLADGEYYLCDLVGLSVSGPEGAVGRVIEVQLYPSVDAIVIEAPNGARFEQPLLGEWLERVDVAARSIALRSLGGLLELSPPQAGSTAKPPPDSGRG
jgi:16S rRNA processing protein RimM